LDVYEATIDCPGGDCQVASGRRSCSSCVWKVSVDGKFLVEEELLVFMDRDVSAANVGFVEEAVLFVLRLEVSVDGKFLVDEELSLVSAADVGFVEEAFVLELLNEEEGKLRFLVNEKEGISWAGMSLRRTPASSRPRSCSCCVWKFLSPCWSSTRSSWSSWPWKAPRWTSASTRSSRGGPGCLCRSRGGRRPRSSRGPGCLCGDWRTRRGSSEAGALARRRRTVRDHQLAPARCARRRWIIFVRSYGLARGAARRSRAGI
jgi:hypothetical protein